MAKWTQSLMATFPAPAAVGSNKKLVLGIGASPWVLWYDENLVNISAPSPGPVAPPVRVVFSPDGNLCVIATASVIYRYDTSGGTVTYLGAFPSPPAWSGIKDVVFNAAGTRLMVVDSAVSPYVWVYNTATWTTVTAPTSGIGAGSLVGAFDGTANSMAAIGTGVVDIHLFDTPGMTVSATQLGTQPSVGAWQAGEFSPDGAYFAVNASGSPSPMRVWKMSSRSAPLANPGTMPADNSSNNAGSLVWNPSGTKFFLGEPFGTSIYNVSGTSVTLDTQFDYNLIGGGYAVWKRDGTKLYMTHRGGTPRFFVKTVAGWTADTNPAVQPTNDPRAIGSNI